MRRLLGFLLVLFVLTGVGACSKGSVAHTPSPTERASDPSNRALTTTAPKPSPRPLVRTPVLLDIPSIGVVSKIVPVGLNKDGSMQTPAYGKKQTGWYRLGPKPGEKGPAVLVGHVDNKQGPDVFAKIGKLEDGDRVYVTDASNSDYVFEVVGKEQVHKRALPYKKIWGATKEPALRLVTCAGDYVSGAYEDNLVVYLSKVR